MYLDDEPDDGPNQYIYLSGFYSIALLNALDDVGIRIDTITNVSCDSLNETKRLFDEMIQRERQEQTLKADVLKDIRMYKIRDVFFLLTLIVISDKDSICKIFFFLNLITNGVTYQMRILSFNKNMFFLFHKSFVNLIN